MSRATSTTPEDHTSTGGPLKAELFHDANAALPISASVDLRCSVGYRAAHGVELTFVAFMSEERGHAEVAYLKNILLRQQQVVQLDISETPDVLP